MGIEKLGITLAKHRGTMLHTLTSQKLLLGRYHLGRLLPAIAHQAHRGLHVFVGQVRVCSFQMQHFEQGFKLVLFKSWLEQPNDFERIEVCGMGGVQVYRGAIALQIESENVVIKIGIVSQQHAAAHILHKALQGLCNRQTGVALQFGHNGVGNVAKHGRNGAFCLDENVESRILHHASCTHFHGRNLHDVVFKDVQTRGFGVENHYLFGIETMGETLDITRFISRKQVGWQHGTAQKGLHKVACGSVTFEYTQTF